MLLPTIFLLIFLCTASSIEVTQKRQSCGSNFMLCSPTGATSDTLGTPGSGWSKLYTDILSTIDSDHSTNDVEPSDNSTGPAKRETAFCCAMTSDCLLLQGFGTPMCWDQFTTDFYFPDGTYGTIVTGNLTTGDGDKVDLVYGNYTLINGMSGNIYSSGGQTTMPNTASMSMPTPWTSSGVGSAIPATQLGTTAILSTFTSVVPGTTILPTTLPSLTITMIATMTGCGHCVGQNTTIEGPTMPGSTRLPSTSIFSTGIFTMPMSNSAQCLDKVSTTLLVIALSLVQISTAC